MDEQEMTEQELLEKLQEIKEQVDQWVQQSEDRLQTLESQMQEAMKLLSPVPEWTRQTFGRISRVEQMLKSLAMNLAHGRVPVRVPPLNVGKRRD